jgi:formate/nitrite transporter
MGGGETMSIIKGPKEAYASFCEKGELLSKTESAKVFFQSFYAGCYIGFGALLAVVISGNLKGWTELNPGFETFVFAALFPVNLLLILVTGGVLFTGTSATCPAALYEGKARLKDVARCLVISWWGNVLGSMVFGYFTLYCGLLEGPTRQTALKIAKKKVAKDFGTTFAKGIGCNWMVCMAVFLQGMAQDMAGKYVAIWLPISTFVMCGFEHIPANFYLLTIGLLSGSDDVDNVTFTDVVWKNWVPVTLGNFVAGAFIVAGGYCYAFGRFGENKKLDADTLKKMKESARKSTGLDPVGVSPQNAEKDFDGLDLEKSVAAPAAEPASDAVKGA